MKTKAPVIFALIFLFLCSCTVQTDFDVFDFCERYNSLREEDIISTDSFLSDGEGGLYCFLTVGESRLLVTLKTDESSAVKSLYVTADRNEYNENDRDAVITTAENLFAAFNYGDMETAQKNLSAIGFDKNCVLFSASFESEMNEKDRYALYSDSYSFTVCVEKNQPD